MPNENNTMIVRPLNCRYCGHGYHGLYHVVQYAQSKGFNIIDMPDTQANKESIYTELNSQDPSSFYGFGHGQPCRYTGDSELDIFTCDDNSILANRTVYLLSCLCGIQLGPSIVKNGAKAFAGYNISWTWLSEGGTEGDPYEDLYAKCFWESANELWIALLDGESFQNAVQRCIEKYNEWIDYWLFENPEDPYSEDCIMWLIHDRNGLVAFGQGIIPPTQQQILSQVIVGSIIVIGLIGLGWYLTSKKPKARYAKR